MKEIHQTVNKQQLEFSDIFEKQVVPELARHNNKIVRRLDLSPEQKIFTENYFRDNLLPFAMPVLLVKQRIRPFLAQCTPISCSAFAAQKATHVAFGICHRENSLRSTAPLYCFALRYQQARIDPLGRHRAQLCFVAFPRLRHPRLLLHQTHPRRRTLHRRRISRRPDLKNQKQSAQTAGRPSKPFRTRPRTCPSTCSNTSKRPSMWADTTCYPKAATTTILTFSNSPILASPTSETNPFHRFLIPY